MGRFIITGAGGLSAAPRDRSSTFHTYTIPHRLTGSGKNSETNSVVLSPIIEASGIYRLEDGRIVLGRECQGNDE